MPADITDSLHLISRATSNPNAIYDTVRQDIFNAFYPATTPGYRDRMIGFISVACYSVAACFVYLFLLWRRKENGTRPNFWVWRTVDRPEMRVVLLNLRMWCVIGGVVSGVSMLAYCLSFGQVYLAHQPLETFNRWRAFIWLPLLAQGYFISLSSLQAFLLCLDDLQLYSLPRLTSWTWNLIACALTIGGIVTGAMMADRGTQLWRTASSILDSLAAVAAQPTPPSASEVAALTATGTRLTQLTNAFRTFAIAQFSLIALATLFILAVNLGSAILCRLMQGKIAQAEARLLAGPCTSIQLAESPTSMSEAGGGSESRRGSAGGKLSKKELERMARPAGREGQQGGEGEVDGTVKERAETVLAMKKALFDLRVVTTVVGSSGAVDLAFEIYIIIYSAKGWLVSRSFSYNEAASLGLLWSQLIVTSASMSVLIFNEWRYRRTFSSSGAATVQQSGVLSV